MMPSALFASSTAPAAPRSASPSPPPPFAVGDLVFVLEGKYKRFTGRVCSLGKATARLRIVDAQTLAPISSQATGNLKFSALARVPGAPKLDAAEFATPRESPTSSPAGSPAGSPATTPPASPLASPRRPLLSPADHGAVPVHDLRDAGVLPRDTIYASPADVLAACDAWMLEHVTSPAVLPDTLLHAFYRVERVPGGDDDDEGAFRCVPIREVIAASSPPKAPKPARRGIVAASPRPPLPPPVVPMPMAKLSRSPSAPKKEEEEETPAPVHGEEREASSDDDDNDAEPPELVDACADAHRRVGVVDHLVPRYLGGMDHVDNLCVMHAAQNLAFANYVTPEKEAFVGRAAMDRAAAVARGGALSLAKAMGVGPAST